MTCINCGRQTTIYYGYCRNCGGSRFQNVNSLDSFWHRFKAGSQPPRTTLEYDYRPHAKKSVSFFSGWWPFKLLSWPVWLGWKLARLLLGSLF